MKDFHRFLANPDDAADTSYLPIAQKLYQWLIAPISSDIEGLNVDTLVFSFDAGLRQLPLAALHDGQQFLVEKYSLGSIPSVSLTSTSYQSLKNAKVLAMGASVFIDKLALPAVPIELAAIAGTIGKGQNPAELPLWPGRFFLNQDFTVENLIKQRQQESFDIIHLATHASFPQNQYGRSEAEIDFWKRSLPQIGRAHV